MTPDPWNSGKIELPDYENDDKITEMVMSGVTLEGGPIWGFVNALSDSVLIINANTFTDGHEGSDPTHLGKPGSHAYFLVDSDGTSADGFTGTLTSMTFMSPNLAIPEVRTPGTVIILR